MKKIGKLSVVKYIVVVVVAILVVLVVSLIASGKKVVYEAPIPLVTVANPVMGQISETLTLSAHVEARSMIPVIPMVSGTILEYPVSVGQTVEKGDLLAVIDEEPFKQQMLQAQAAYTGYEKTFQRISGLYQAGAATRQEYDTVKSQRDAAKAQYDLSLLQMSYAQVTSPVSGTVISAPLAVGSIAGSPQPVAIVADLSELVVKLNVPEKYYSLFVESTETLKAQVIKSGVVGKDEEVCEATIDTIASYVDGVSKTFEATFRLTEPPETFKPGMFVKVIVIFREMTKIPLIPLTAQSSDGRVYIFEKGEETFDGFTGTAKSITFDTVLSDSQWIMVPEKYVDELFIIEGQSSVLSGQKLKGKKEDLVWKDK